MENKTDQLITWKEALDTELSSVNQENSKIQDMILKSNDKVDNRFENLKNEFDVKSDGLNNILSTIQKDLLQTNQILDSDMKSVQEQNLNLAASLMKTQDRLAEFENSTKEILNQYNNDRLNENLKTLTHINDKFGQAINEFDKKHQELENFLQHELKTNKYYINCELSKIGLDYNKIISELKQEFTRDFNTMLHKIDGLGTEINLKSQEDKESIKQDISSTIDTAINDIDTKIKYETLHQSERYTKIQERFEEFGCQIQEISSKLKEYQDPMTYEKIDKMIKAEKVLILQSIILKTDGQIDKNEQKLLDKLNQMEINLKSMQDSYVNQKMKDIIDLMQQKFKENQFIEQITTLKNEIEKIINEISEFKVEFQLKVAEYTPKEESPLEPKSPLEVKSPLEAKSPTLNYEILQNIKSEMMKIVEAKIHHFEDEMKHLEHSFVEKTDKINENLQGFNLSIILSNDSREENIKFCSNEISKLSNKIQGMSEINENIQEKISIMETIFSCEYRENLNKKLEELEKNSSSDSRKLKGSIQKIEERIQDLEKSLTPEFKDRITKAIATFESIPKIKKEIDSKVKIDINQFKEKTVDIDIFNKFKEECYINITKLEEKLLIKLEEQLHTSLSNSLLPIISHEFYRY